MEYRDLLFKKSNLEFNDSISTYNGWGAQQNPHAFEVFFNFIKEVKPARIIEIGTALGGFTMFLNYCCKELNSQTKIHTFDILDRHAYKVLTQEGIGVHIENIFEKDFLEIPTEYVELIQNPGVTLVLCDGGDKIREFNLLSTYLKPGDFILAHDYAIDRTDFEERVNKQLWNWFEIQESDIAQACLDNNLIDFKREEFNKGVWVCKVKTNE